MKKCLFKVKNLIKTFKVGKQDVKVLRGINFEVYEGDFTLIVGPSGCGKSTFLHILLGLEEPTNGFVKYSGWKKTDINIYKDLNEDERADYRKLNIGMIYQQPYWIRSLNVAENVAFPLMLRGVLESQRLFLALDMLKKVGMINWAKYQIPELSSGQQQKVSLARALISKPKVIFADEPTGNLDYNSGLDLVKTLQDLNSKENKTIIMVTHDVEYLKFAKSIAKMVDGEIVAEYKGKDRFKILSNDKLFLYRKKT